MVSAGEAHISSMVAAYEVGTVTSKVRPVASFKAAAITSPPVTMMFASTEGTNNTLIGCSGEPTAGMGGSVATGASVGASVAGASVATGASVAAGPQADNIIEAATMRVNRTKTKRLFISSPLRDIRLMGW